MKKALFLMNPNSGTRQGRRFLPEMISRLTEAGYLCSVLITGKRGDAEEWTRSYAGGMNLVVACGGDGTLNEVVTGLITGGLRTPVGYIPCGSTNDFAASLRIATDPLRACAGIAEGMPRNLDVGRFGEDRFFTYTASFGAFTEVSYNTPQNVKNILGHTAYILAGIASLAGIHPIHMKIATDDRELEGDYLFGAICNSTSLGGVLRLENSEVHMNDGLFESLLIPFPEDILALRRILAALSGHDYGNPCLQFIRSSFFRVESDPDVCWSLDGEAAEGGGILEIRNIHDAMTLICGEDRAEETEEDVPV